MLVEPLAVFSWSVIALTAGLAALGSLGIRTPRARHRFEHGQPPQRRHAAPVVRLVKSNDTTIRSQDSDPSHQRAA